MTRIPILLILTVLVLSGCSKEPVNTGSLFSFRGDTASVMRMATHDTCSLIITAEDVVSCFWDFGDGNYSHDFKPVISYHERGLYSVNLRLMDSKGNITEFTKKVQVLDRVLKRIGIYVLKWDNDGSNGWPTESTVDIFATVAHYTDDTMTQPGIFPNCQVLGSSLVHEDVRRTHPHEVRILRFNERVVIDRNLIKAPADMEPGNSYLFSLMAIDSNGSVYRLHTNSGTDNTSYPELPGKSFKLTSEDFNLNISIIQWQVPDRFFCDVVCEFEE